MERPTSRDHQTWRGAALWLLPLGLAVGLIWAGVFRLTWRIFGEVSGVRLMPALFVLLLDAAIFGYGQYWGVARVVARWPRGRRETTLDDPPSSAVAPMLALVLTGFSFWVIVLCIPNRPGYWPGGWLSALGLIELYPRPIFRPLILAPVWGCWAMLMAANVGRTHPSSTAHALCGAVRSTLVLGSFVPLTLITAIYCGQRSNRLIGVIISLIVWGVTHLISSMLGRRLGGQSYDTLFAAARAALLTFLLCYIVAAIRF